MSSKKVNVTPTDTEGAMNSQLDKEDGDRPLSLTFEKRTRGSLRQARRTLSDADAGAIETVQFLAAEANAFGLLAVAAAIREATDTLGGSRRAD